MSNNTFSAEDYQIILNCNKLIHLWHPALSHHVTWQPEEGSITVYENEHSAEDEYSVEDEHSAFGEDLKTLLIHCEKFHALIAKRLQDLSEIAASNLPQLYKKAQMLHGLHLLLTHYHKNIYRKAEYCATKIVELATANNEAPLIILIDSVLQELLNSKQQISQLQKMQELLLNKMYATTIPCTLALNAASENVPIIVKMPRQIEIGQFMHSNGPVSIRAYLTSDDLPLLQPMTPLLADLTTIQFYWKNKAVPVLLQAYPRWPTETNISTMTLAEFQTCPEGAHCRFTDFTTTSSMGIVPYQQPFLATTLCGPFAKPAMQSLLPRYFQAMVEIAKAHHCYQVVCFIPFDFTLIAHAMGFYSDKDDEKSRYQQMLEQFVANNQSLELLDESVNQFGESEELCRPVYFPLNEIATRTAHLEGLGHITTYAEVINKMPLFPHNRDEGIIPDPCGFMAKPICSFFNAIRNQQITGKTVPMLGRTYLSETVDYIWLTDNQTLIGIGESSHLASTEQKMVTRFLK